MKLNVYPHFQFDIEMIKNGWLTEDMVPANVAIISICSVDDTDVEHYYSKSTANILNIEFNDCAENEYGCLTEEQASLIYSFIKSNIGKDFYIHCTAGKSRSQGIARFILDCYPEFNYKTRINNPCNTPNYHVVTLLKRACKAN